MAHTHPGNERHETGLWRSRRPGTSHFFVILGCTDLRISVSGAKFDARADFEVRLPPAPPKHPENFQKLREISEKKIKFFFKKILMFFFLPKASECIRMHPNAQKQVRTGPKTSKHFAKTSTNLFLFPFGCNFLSVPRWNGVLASGACLYRRVNGASGARC